MHKKLIWMEFDIYSVMSQTGNIWIKDMMTTQKDQSQKKGI